MKRTESNRKSILLLLLLLVLQVIAAFCFCGKKTGYHYDEYYSYYSSNVTMGVGPWDQDWKTGEDIFNEFAVLPGEQFQFGRVVEMQTYDVHPPVYYLFLHGICSLIPGIFSKWAGLALNLLFFVGSWCLIAWLAWHVGGKRKEIVFASCLLYGFCPAVFSGIMLVRMYTMLGFWILLLTCLHVKALERRKRGGRFYLPLMAMIMAGFLTHYYFAVYLFFMAAAMECYLLFEKAEQKTLGGRLKDCFAYGFAAVGAMLLSVALYPASASHIFRGYRGTEAMGAFFDLSNTAGRISFFLELLNEYAFGSMLPFFALILVLLALTSVMLGRHGRRAGRPACLTGAGAESGCGKTFSADPDSGRLSFLEQQRVRLITAAAALGYFAVVTKTALLTAEEANRYQIPVYGLLIVLSVSLFFLLAEKTCARLETCLAAHGRLNFLRASRILTAAVVLLLAAGQIGGLCSGKVLFLYEEDAAPIAAAKENADTTVVYFFSDAQKWMTWDDSLELMQYENLYFVSLSDEGTLTEEIFADQRIAEADRLLVYCMRHDNSEKALEVLLDSCEKLQKCEKIRELLYCDLYELTP